MFILYSFIRSRKRFKRKILKTVYIPIYLCQNLVRIKISIRISNSDFQSHQPSHSFKFLQWELTRFSWNGTLPTNQMVSFEAISSPSLMIKVVYKENFIIYVSIMRAIRLLSFRWYRRDLCTPSTNSLFTREGSFWFSL